MNENDKSLSRDPRIIPLVRSLKEEQIRAIKLLNTRGEDIAKVKKLLIIITIIIKMIKKNQKV